MINVQIGPYWAAWYNAWHLITMTLSGVVFSFSFSTLVRMCVQTLCV